MVEETKIKTEIYRNEIKKGITGNMLEQKELSVTGDNLDKVKEVFDEEWIK